MCMYIVSSAVRLPLQSNESKKCDETANNVLFPMLACGIADL